MKPEHAGMAVIRNKKFYKNAPKDQTLGAFFTEVFMKRDRRLFRR